MSPKDLPSIHAITRTQRMISRHREIFKELLQYERMDPAMQAGMRAARAADERAYVEINNNWLRGMIPKRSRPEDIDHIRWLTARINEMQHAIEQLRKENHRDMMIMQKTKEENTSLRDRIDKLSRQARL